MTAEWAGRDGVEWAKVPQQFTGFASWVMGSSHLRWKYLPCLPLSLYLCVSEFSQCNECFVAPFLFVPYSQELLDETGLLPLLNDAGGGGDDAASIASAMGLLSDALTGEHTSGSGGASGGGGSGSSPLDEDKDSWERGVAVPSDPEEEAHSVEKGLRSAGGGGDAEEVDQVDVIMQVRYAV